MAWEHLTAEWSPLVYLAGITHKQFYRFLKNHCIREFLGGRLRARNHETTKTHVSLYFQLAFSVISKMILVTVSALLRLIAVSFNK